MIPKNMKRVLMKKQDCVVSRMKLFLVTVLNEEDVDEEASLCGFKDENLLLGLGLETEDPLTLRRWKRRVCLQSIGGEGLCYNGGAPSVKNQKADSWPQHSTNSTAVMRSQTGRGWDESRRERRSAADRSL